MECKRYDKENFFARYLQGELPAAAADEFESHCFTCDACFRKLREAEALIGLIRRLPREALSTPKHPARPFFLRPAFVLPAAAAAVALLILLVPGSGQKSRLRELARRVPIEAPLYVSGEIRHFGTPSPFARLLASAMEMYQKRDYGAAAVTLKEILRLEPDNPQAHFYFGASLLMTSHPEPALVHFDRLIELKSQPYLEDSHWYAAMACLQSGRGDAAKRHLQALVEIMGKYSRAAKDILSRIAQLPQ